AKVAFHTAPTDQNNAEAMGESATPSAIVSAATAQVIAAPPAKPCPPKRIPIAPALGKVEKPNLREPLSAELEAELNAALGDKSLDDLIASETGGASTPAGEPLEIESRHKAKVLRIFRDNVFVDLGGRNQGVLVLHQLPEEPEVGVV